MSWTQLTLRPRGLTPIATATFRLPMVRRQLARPVASTCKTLGLTTCSLWDSPTWPPSHRCSLLALCRIRPAGIQRLAVMSVVLVLSVAEAASATRAGVVTTIDPAPMIVLAILAGVRTGVRAVARPADGSAVVAGVTVLAVVQLLVLVKRFRVVRSRATKIWIKPVVAVVGS